jgi:hypothetical protein
LCQPRLKIMPDLDHCQGLVANLSISLKVE